jgi:hypothetical protein
LDNPAAVVTVEQWDPVLKVIDITLGLDFKEFYELASTVFEKEQLK